MRFDKAAALPGSGHGRETGVLPAEASAAGCLHEVHAVAGDWAAATAFALTMLGGAQAGAQAGAIVTIRSARGKLPASVYGASVYGASVYGEGLIALGLAPERLLLAHAASNLEMLRAAAEAARCGGIAAVLVEMWGRCPEWGLTASRRLSLAAERSGVSVLILRGDAQEQPSSAQTRWSIASAPSIALSANAPGLPAIDAHLLRQRGGPAGTHWRLEWDSEYGRFRTARSDEAALPGTVVPLSGLRAGSGAFSRAA